MTLARVAVEIRLHGVTSTECVAFVALGGSDVPEVRVRRRSGHWVCDEHGLGDPSLCLHTQFAAALYTTAVTALLPATPRRPNRKAGPS